MDRRSRRFEVGAVLVAAIVALAGCAGSTSPSPTSTPTSAPSEPASTATAEPSPTAEPVDVTIGYPSPSVAYIAVFVADSLGYFADENVEAELLQVAPPVAINAMLSGDLDYVLLLGSTLRGAATGLAIKAVAVYSDKPQDTLLSIPSVSSVNDLVGRPIGVDTIGATTHVLTVEVLRQLGFDIENAQFVVAGDEAARLQQLIGGQIAAGMLGPQGRIEGEAAGLNVLAEAADMVPLPLGGIGTTDEKLSNSRDEVERVLRATLRGQQVVLNDKATTVEIMQEYLDLAPDVASETYDIVLASYSADGTASDDAIRFNLDLARQAGTEIPLGISLDQVRDFTIVLEIASELGLG
jgi:ABC-type nitrate/sulfonate/bicarbonate transport system substrate-binding protein